MANEKVAQIRKAQRELKKLQGLCIHLTCTNKVDKRLLTNKNYAYCQVHRHYFRNKRREVVKRR